MRYNPGPEKFTIEDIRRLRVQGKSVSQIAEDLGVRVSSLYEKLKARGVTMADLTPDDVSVPQGRRPSFTIAQLRAAWTPGMSKDEVAAALGVKWSTILYRLRREGIPMSKVAPKGTKVRTTKIDLRKVRDLRAEGLTFSEIGEELGVDPTAVSKALSRKGTSLKKITPKSVEVKVGRPGYITMDDIKAKYEHRGMTKADIARALGVDRGSVQYRLKSAGLTLADLTPQSELEPEIPIEVGPFSPREVIRLYATEGLTISEIADVFAVTEEYVRSRLGARLVDIQDLAQEHLAARRSKSRSNPDFDDEDFDIYNIETRVTDMSSWGNYADDKDLKALALIGRYADEEDEFTIGQVNLKKVWDGGNLLDFLEGSNCYEAIIEQIEKNGSPEYIYYVSGSELSSDMPQSRGLGERLYLDCFDYLANTLAANVLIVADECMGEDRTSRIAQGLWRKLMRYQDAEYPFAWYQKYEDGRSNPWLKNQLYFRYGFWDLEPGANMIYHVTPALSSVLKSGELSPPSMRRSGNTGLGGIHNASVSFYGSLSRAVYTLVYMYRIWQLENGYHEDLKALLEHNDAGIDTKTHIGKLIDDARPGSSVFVINRIREMLRAHNPMIMGGASWIRKAAIEDFAILVFENPCRHLFLPDVYSSIESFGRPFQERQGCIRAFTQQSVRDLSSSCDQKDRSYFNMGGLYELSYGDIQHAIQEGASTVELDIEPRVMFDKLFGRNPSDILASQRDQPLIRFENITFDMRPQSVKIRDLCEYKESEQEFRVFRELPMSDVVRIYTIDDILREARKCNGGVEPFFWDWYCGMGGTSSRWSDFHFSTWEDDV
jgi:DNA-directed RNA polymerase specialized sigma24 family protein